MGKDAKVTPQGTSFVSVMQEKHNIETKIRAINLLPGHVINHNCANNNFEVMTMIKYRR